MKKIIFALTLTLSQLSLAAIPEGYICVKPQDISIFSGPNSLFNLGADLQIRFVDQYFYRVENQASDEVAMTKGFVGGVMMAAVLAKRKLLVNPGVWADLASNKSSFCLSFQDGSKSVAIKFARALMIDINNVCSEQPAKTN